MTRVMIDTTHDGLSSALSAIRSLSAGDLVALYDTGSPDIAATPADLASIPPYLRTVLIDQGFTGSPNPLANVRDCENGAWDLEHAIDKTGWFVARPTLYLGFPDTAQQAYDLGWRGDVWLVNSASSPPTSPARVPSGLNVVAEQWDFSAIFYDRSVVFDPTWPRSATMPVPTPPPGQWLSAKTWTWQDVVIIGRGLDNNLYEFAYNPVTGQWVAVHPFSGESRV